MKTVCIFSTPLDPAKKIISIRFVDWIVNNKNKSEQYRLKSWIVLDGVEIGQSINIFVSVSV